MKRMLVASAVIVIGLSPLGATESSRPVYVRLAMVLRAPVEAPSFTNKVNYWGKCGQDCDGIICFDDERPEFDSATGKCLGCWPGDSIGKSCGDTQKKD